MADVEKARELIQESLGARGSYLENVSKVLDKTLRVHENGASFYEKLNGELRCDFGPGW